MTDDEKEVPFEMVINPDFNLSDLRHRFASRYTAERINRKYHAHYSPAARKRKKHLRNISKASRKKNR